MAGYQFLTVLSEGFVLLEDFIPLSMLDRLVLGENLSCFVQSPAVYGAAGGGGGPGAVPGWKDLQAAQPGETLYQDDPDQQGVPWSLGAAA